MMAKEYMSLGLLRSRVLAILDISKHDLYYKSTGRPSGKRLSTETLWLNLKTGEEQWKSNEEVITQIIEIRNDPDLPNYYKLICAALQLKGWYINHKKVYRLEKSFGLLCKAKKKKGRQFVSHRRVVPEGPLRIIEMDIKYVWISGKRCFAFILTAIDTFTRYVLGWRVGYHMRSAQVKALWDGIITNYLQPADLLNQEIEVEVRNDNGKQFSAEVIQLYFKQNYLNQVFTHPYSPQENGHIESFHKTLSTALDKDRFPCIEELELRLERFYKVYNNERPHGSIAQISPSMFWSLWEQGNIESVQRNEKEVRFYLTIKRQEVLLQPEINKYKIK